jgi:hypothetical protein
MGHGDIGGAEPEARHHCEAGARRQLRHGQRGPAAAERVQLAVGRHHGAVGEEREAQLHLATIVA